MINKMNNDRYKIQNPPASTQILKPVTQTNSSKPNNNFSIIYSNISSIPEVQQFGYTQPQQSQFQSESTIRTVSQGDGPAINSPNHAAYSSNEDQKMLICKSQLVAFAQCFAQQKIQLQNSFSQLNTKNNQLLQQISVLRQENTKLKSTIQPYPHSPLAQQQIQTLKSKLNLQFEKRITAQKQFHTQKALCFELNKKLQFMTEKLVYQEEQVKRCQQLLKIKQDIILNFQWEKTITTARNQKSEGNITERQSQNQHKNFVQSQNSPEVKKNTQLKKYTQNSIKTQSNQAINLSEINLNRNISINQSINRDSAQNQSTKKVTKYVIGKKPSEFNHDSKKKLNVSLQKKSPTNSLGKIDLSKNKDQQKEKPKPKNILIKIHRDNQSLSMNEPSSQTTLKNQKNETKIRDLQNHYMKIINALENEISSLKNQLNENNFNVSEFKNESTILKMHNKNLSTGDLSDIQRKYNMMKQKCSLLQNQIQKTVNKFISLQQKNIQLQKLVVHLQNQIFLSQSKNYQQESKYEFQRQNKPRLQIGDLVTPQFRETKFNNNFFPKSKEENHSQKLFQNISLHQKGYENRNGFLDTFEKRKVPTENSFIQMKASNSLFVDGKASFLNHSKNIEDISEIMCRNDDEEILDEGF